MNIYLDNMTQDGNAQLFVNHYQDILKFNINSGKWLIWDDIHWKPEIAHEKPELYVFRKFIQKMIQELSNLESHEERDILNKWIKRSQTKHHMYDVLELASSYREIQISQHHLDANPLYLNCLNGTINLETNAIHNHSKDDYLTRYIPVEYHKDEDCPFFLEFLNTITNSNQDVITYLQTAIGYSLTGLHSEEVLFFLYGTGKNGKTTFMNVLATLLGIYQQRIGINSILQSRNDRVKTEFAQLPGVRIVHTSEIPENRKLDESLVKDLTGGDPIRTRFLYKEWFEFKPVFKLWMFGNHKPIITGTDEGIWRRIKLIPFTIEIPEEKRLPRHIIEQKLNDELSGILNWALEGCQYWLQHGLYEPVCIAEATKIYRNEMNIIATFIDENCQLDNTCGILCSELYDAYKVWSKQTNTFCYGKQLFNKKLLETESSLKKKRLSQGISIIGISLKNKNTS